VELLEDLECMVEDGDHQDLALDQAADMKVIIGKVMGSHRSHPPLPKTMEEDLATMENITKQPRT
jgi:hypothetical protein